MMSHRIIDTERDRAEFAQLLGNLKLPFTVEWVQGRDRTKDQNALQWLWATEAARQLGDRAPDEMQRDWKLRHGVPILREESASFREKYDSMIRPLSYEQKVAVMEIIDVTSIMTVRQMVAFLDAVERECLEQGLRLTNPDPSLATYQARYRRKEAA